MDRQDKPLSEWTLGEVQTLCEKQNGYTCCDGCPFANVIGNCILRVLPEEWDLKEAPCLTKKEIAIMKAVGAKWVSRDTDDNGDDGIVELWDEKPNYNSTFFFGNGDSVVLGRIAGSLFPSVHPGECICVEEVEKW